MSEINQLFNTLLHSKMIEVFSWASLMKILFIGIVSFIFLYLCINLTNWFKNKKVQVFVCLIISLIPIFLLGRFSGVLSKTGEPIKQKYEVTQPQKVKSSVSEIAKEYPYTLIVNTPSPDPDETEQTQYFVFSNSSKQIESLDDKFENNSSDLAFLKSGKSTVIVEATYNSDTEMLTKYKTVSQVGLSTNNWTTQFINTGQLNTSNLKYDSDD